MSDLEKWLKLVGAYEDLLRVYAARDQGMEVLMALEQQLFQAKADLGLQRTAMGTYLLEAPEVVSE